MIIRWIDDLEEAAKARSRAQTALDGERISPAEAKKLELEITQRNRDIEIYAQRINDELKRAAEKREPVSYSHHLETIQDRQLQDYLSGVKGTIDRLNHQLMTDGKNADTFARSLKRQEENTLRMEEGAAKNQAVLAKEDQKLARREAELKKRLEDRQNDLKKIEAELKRVGSDKKRLQDERDRVKDVERQRQREIDLLQNQRRGLEQQKKIEPNFDRRQLVKAKIAKLDPAIAQNKEFLEKHVRFQLDQFAKIEEKIRFEVGQLNKAVGGVKADMDTLKKELADLKKARAAIRDNIDREGKRKSALAVAAKDVKRAQAQALKAGIKG